MGAATVPPDGDRPTVVPDFDPEAFARDSEQKQRTALDAEAPPTLEEARRLHRDGAHERALFLVARLLEADPLHVEANRLSRDCRAALEAECLAAVGSLSSTLVVAVPPKDLRSLALDHVSGFLLSLLDGATDVETLLDISGLPRLLALRHLRSLLERGVVVVGSRSRFR